ncbi:hypothetical protein SAMN04487948_104171 [Halogranum amylolyticum]|uniref:Uncharacterized protein n=1 Tax=Halogranum amylolyticum TaxID=660520 RepID=A0A1H8RQ99_9EURY|nr:hypothetical protein [Halogranum amylolyticum]SEO68545.1 hypothetical protein SAMN04487948_104171 [Halogranum amylolyticum]
MIAAKDSVHDYVSLDPLAQDLVDGTAIEHVDAARDVLGVRASRGD